MKGSGRDRREGGRAMRDWKRKRGGTTQREGRGTLDEGHLNFIDTYWVCLPTGRTPAGSHGRHDSPPPLPPPLPRRSHSPPSGRAQAPTVDPANNENNPRPHQGECAVWNPMCMGGCVLSTGGRPLSCTAVRRRACDRSIRVPLREQLACLAKMSRERADERAGARVGYGGKLLRRTVVQAEVVPCVRMRAGGEANRPSSQRADRQDETGVDCARRATGNETREF